MARLATMAERLHHSKIEQSVSGHIPISQAALCEELKCGAVFNAIHHETCPACGSGQVALLVSWLKLQGEIAVARWRPES